MISENVVQKRWKVLREKFSVAYRKFTKDKILPSWSLYESCSFLQPFVNLKLDATKQPDDEEESLLVEKRAPIKSPFDESILTQLVKERPILYDKRHEDFRAANLRKKTWNEISIISGWDVKTLQRRWRVMRDRFVRELRRTKNIEIDKQINCTPFFRDMLFLAGHVKSKRYEAEATDGLSDDENWDQQESSGDDTKPRIDEMETCIIAGPLKENHFEESYDIDDSVQYDECYEADNLTEQETYDENPEIADETEDQLETEETFCDENVEQHVMSEDETVAQEEQWFSQSTTKEKKHRISVEYSEEPVCKRKARQSESSSTASQRVDAKPESLDENIMFGKTIGLMLQKYPPHLQTAVKLELFQCLANFDIKHRLDLQ